MYVKPEKEERFLEVITQNVSTMKNEEPETRVYAFWRTRNPLEYVLIESFLTKEAFDYHVDRHLHTQKEFATFFSRPPETSVLGDFVVGWPDVGTLPLE